MKSLFKNKIGAVDFNWMTDYILNELCKNGFVYFDNLYHPITGESAEGYQLSYFGTDIFIYEEVIIVFSDGLIQEEFYIESNFIEAFNKIKNIL